MVLDAGVAGIHNVATIPEARSQGTGKLMTLNPLFEKTELGYRVATLPASLMGYPLYQQMGFKDICKLQLYLHARSPATNFI